MNHLFLTGSKEDNQIINSIVARETRSFGRGTTEGVSAAWSQSGNRPVRLWEILVRSTMPNATAITLHSATLMGMFRRPS